jgi:hypothetical protein
MYNMKVKVQQVLDNDKSRLTRKTMFYQEKTKLLVEAGYTRKFARSIIRTSANKIGTIGDSPFTKTNPRRSRREMANKLLVPFNPRYNGPVFNTIWTRTENGWSKELVNV